MIVGAIALGLTAKYDGAFAPMPLFAIPEALTLILGEIRVLSYGATRRQRISPLFLFYVPLWGRRWLSSGLKSMAGRYIAGWIPAIILYALIFSREIIQQSYFQMPFAAFICLATGYAFIGLESIPGISLLPPWPLL